MSKTSLAIAALILFSSAPTLAQDIYTWPTNPLNVTSITIANVTKPIRVKIKKLAGNTVGITIACGTRIKTVEDAGALTFDCDGTASGVDLIVRCGSGTGGTCKFEITDITK